MGLDYWLADDPKSHDKTCEICEAQAGEQLFGDQWTCDNCKEALSEDFGECDHCNRLYDLGGDDHCGECGTCWECCTNDHKPKWESN